MWPVDDVWKATVRADMQRTGVSQAEMARRIGCKQSALTVLFRPETKQSRLVPLIHRELGRPAPSTVAAPDEVLRRINRLWSSLSKEARVLIDNLVVQLATGSYKQR